MVTLQKRVTLNRSFILSKISEYDIFKMYYPYDFEINRVCLSPFIQEDNPSFIIGNKYGSLTFKAFNTPHRGDCFHFVMFLYNLTYNEALTKIAKDFKLLEGDYYKRIISTYEKPKIIKKPTFIQAVPKKFSEKDLSYLASFHLEPSDLNFCEDTKAYSTKEWAINRRRQFLEKDEVCFFYNLINERGSWIKVYRPHAEKKDKWKTNIPFHEMCGLSNLKGSKVGFIQKSMKDGAFTAKYISPHVTVVSAEDINAITKDNIDFINQNCEKVYVIFDNDETGVRACKEITRETGWSYINPPNHLLIEGITDFADWGRATDPSTIIDYFKQKRVI